MAHSFASVGCPPDHHCPWHLVHSNRPNTVTLPHWVDGSDGYQPRTVLCSAWQSSQHWAAWSASLLLVALPCQSERSQSVLTSPILGSDGTSRMETRQGTKGYDLLIGRVMRFSKAILLVGGGPQWSGHTEWRYSEEWVLLLLTVFPLLQTWAFAQLIDRLLVPVKNQSAYKSFNTGTSWARERMTRFPIRTEDRT
jgi:hypothetical protein